MKKLSIPLLIISLFLITCMQQNTHAYADTELVKYTGTIEHIFTHCLLSDPSVALDKNNPLCKDYARDCITTNEFKNILDQLVENNYILVNINDIYENVNGVIKKKDLYLPKGKKPLIMSFDDVNYDHRKSGHGMVDKIILTPSGELATYTESTDCIGRDNEFIVILEDFIKRHPEFSYNGARGTICLTGYDGILGYRTQHKNPNYKSEIEKVRPIINRLKDLGWTFACHSFGHYHMNKIDTQKFNEELKLWRDEVEPLIGKTKVYVYPYGEWQVYENGEICEKHRLLMEYGFELFCGVGIKPYFSYLPTKCHNKVLFMDRTVIDGYSLTNKKTELSRLFSVDEVYDYKYRNGISIPRY